MEVLLLHKHKSVTQLSELSIWDLPDLGPTYKPCFNQHLVV